MRVTHFTLPVTLRPCPPRTVTLRYAERCGAGSGYGTIEVPVPGLTDKVRLDVMAVHFPDDLMATSMVNQRLRDMDLIGLDQLLVILRLVDLHLAGQFPAVALGAGVRVGRSVRYPCLVDGQFCTRHCGDGYEWRSGVWDFLALPCEQAARLHALLC